MESPENRSGRESALLAKRIPLWKESRGRWTLTSAGSNGRQQRDHAGGLARQDTTVMNTLLRKHSCPGAGRSCGSVGEYCCTPRALHSLTPTIIPGAITITDANRSGISNSFNAIQPRGLVEMTRRRAAIDSADRLARMRFIRSADQFFVDQLPSRWSPRCHITQVIRSPGTLKIHRSSHYS